MKEMKRKTEEIKDERRRRRRRSKNVCFAPSFLVLSLAFLDSAVEAEI